MQGPARLHFRDQAPPGILCCFLPHVHLPLAPHTPGRFHRGHWSHHRVSCEVGEARTSSWVLRKLGAQAGTVRRHRPLERYRRLLHPHIRDLSWSWVTAARPDSWQISQRGWYHRRDELSRTLSWWTEVVCHGFAILPACRQQPLGQGGMGMSGGPATSRTRPVCLHSRRALGSLPQDISSWGLLASTSWAPEICLFKLRLWTWGEQRAKKKELPQDEPVSALEWESLSGYSPGWPLTHCVDEGDRERLRLLPPPPPPPGFFDDRHVPLQPI